MLQVARLAPNLLQEATDSVAEFFLSQFNKDGGAADRSGQSDLYYTVFAIEGLIALQRESPSHVHLFLESFEDGQDLDLVHLCCLARCWTALKKTAPPALAGKINDRWDRHSIYQSFLAWGALQDLGCQPKPFPLRDGTFADTTPTTAATVTLLRQMQAPVPEQAVQWLLARAHPAGGFSATKEVQIPDLLSTATALHALSGQHVPLAHLKEKTLDFLDTLWTGRAFCGNWSDDKSDCEYTYYALLTMGHLSLA